jgi:hypothetical protein
MIQIESVTLWTLITLISILWFLLGLAIGMISERKDWNKLIEQGKIPKPNKDE